MTPVLLAIAIAGWLWFVFDDQKTYQAAERLTSTAERQRWYRGWLAKAFAFFLVFALVGLLLLGELSGLVILPAASAVFAREARDLGALSELSSEFLIGMAVAFFGGTTISAFFAAGGHSGNTAGKFQALLPRNGPERLWAALLSLNAGVSEEVFFRLFLPLLFINLLGDPLLAFGLSAAMFGVSHLYQGLGGVVGTTLFAVLVTVVYLATGQLWIAIALHVAIDLNVLLLQPFLTSIFRRTPRP